MEYVPIDSLIPASYNPRKISEVEMQKLVDSIALVGFIDPIIVNRDNTIIGGHQRVKAAKRLGYVEIPVVHVDLDKDDEKALNIAMNRLGGSFDEELLAQLLKTLADDKRKDTGLDKAEIARLTKAYEAQMVDSKKADDQLVESKHVVCPTCGQKVEKDNV